MEANLCYLYSGCSFSRTPFPLPCLGPAVVGVTGAVAQHWGCKPCCSPDTSTWAQGHLQGHPDEPHIPTDAPRPQSFSFRASFVTRVSEQTPYPWLSSHIKQATTPHSWLRAVWNRMSLSTLIFNEDWRQTWIIFIPVSPTWQTLISIFAEKNELWVWKAILRGKS